MKIFCGVDVSKKWLDGWIRTAGHKRFANTPEGLEVLAAWCCEHGAELVVMEASGGLERSAFLTLWKLGQPCAIANARSVRLFAQSMGRLEKTDRIDAEMIAAYAEAKKMVATKPASPEQQKLTALAARLRQVTSDLTVQKQRLHTTSEPVALASLKDLIAFLKGQAKAITTEMASLIEADPLWAALDRAFRSIKGFADRGVAYLLAEVPEIGTLSNRAITKLVGLAPLPDDSGQRKGRRAIRGGRAEIRAILFLLADVVRKFDKSFADFKKRLLEKGLEKMEVRIALARKLIVRLNAKARDTRAALPAT